MQQDQVIDHRIDPFSSADHLQWWQINHAVDSLASEEGHLLGLMSHDLQLMHPKNPVEKNALATNARELMSAESTHDALVYDLVRDQQQTMQLFDSSQGKTQSVSHSETPTGHHSSFEIALVAIVVIGAVAGLVSYLLDNLTAVKSNRHKSTFMMWFNQRFGKAFSYLLENDQAGLLDSSNLLAWNPELCRDKLLDLASNSGGERSSTRYFFSLPISQICGQLNNAVEMAITYPKEYGDILMALAGGEKSTSRSVEYLMNYSYLDDSGEGDQYNPELMAARSRITFRVQRAIDNLQIVGAAKWRSFQIALTLIIGVFLGILLGLLRPHFSIPWYLGVTLGGVFLALAIGQLFYLARKSSQRA